MQILVPMLLSENHWAGDVCGPRRRGRTPRFVWENSGYLNRGCSGDPSKFDLLKLKEKSKNHKHLTFFSSFQVASLGCLFIFTFFFVELVDSSMIQGGELDFRQIAG